MRGPAPSILSSFVSLTVPMTSLWSNTTHALLIAVGRGRRDEVISYKQFLCTMECLQIDLLTLYTEHCLTKIIIIMTYSNLKLYACMCTCMCSRMQ